MRCVFDLAAVIVNRDDGPGDLGYHGCEGHVPDAVPITSAIVVAWFGEKWLAVLDCYYALF